MEYIAGIDLGGTNIKAMLMDRQANIVQKYACPTPGRNMSDTLNAMTAAIVRMLEYSSADKKSLIGIGVGIPGPTDNKSGMAYSVPFFGWTNVDFASPLRECLGVPVCVENDGNVNTLGEMRFGAGRGYKNAVMLVIGTGLGSGIVVDGTLLRGKANTAGEVGHMTIDSMGGKCACGKTGCLESFCSATAIVRYASIYAAEGGDTILNEYTGNDMTRVTSEMVARGFISGDAVCRRVFELFTSKLSVGIVNLIDLFNPDIVIIGGGVSKAADIFMVPLRSMVSAMLMHDIQRCDLVCGQLHSDAGILGACSLAADVLGIPL
jgi:glucokinase